jgi:Ca2+-binding RTX toxin-like protein
LQQPQERKSPDQLEMIMVGFTGGAGTFNSGGVVYEWSDVIAVFENNVIVDYFTQFAGDALPGSSTDVTIGNFNVQLTQLTYRHVGGAVGVNNLTLNSGAEFTQGATNFVISGRLTNNGLMNATATMTFTGAIENNHLMTIGTGDGNVRFMRLAPVNGDFTLSGSGDMRLRDGFLTGQGGPSSVTDFSNASRISGYGTIGSEFGWSAFPSDGGYLAITNTAAGVIEADVAGRMLTIQPDLTAANPVINAGLMTASNGGILRFYGHGGQVFVEQSGAGTISAQNGAIVALDGAVIRGGTLHGVGTGIIRLEGAQTRLADLDISSTATVNMGRNAALEGRIENRGRMIASEFQTGTVIDADDVTLTGGGTFRMVGNYGRTTISGEALGAVLTNLAHTITGVGDIAGENLSVVNQGVISATPDSYSPTGTDELRLSALAGLRNEGVLEARGNATNLSLTFMQGVDNTGGTIRAVGNGASVGLREISISGGTFATTGTGIIRADGFNVRLGDFQTLAGTNINLAYMTLTGDVVNRGTMTAPGFLTVDGDLDLSGAGRILTQGANIVGRVAGAVLTNGSTIIGDGAIGVGVGIHNQAGNLSVINTGNMIADANAQSGPDTLALATLAGLTNSGLLEARNGATLAIDLDASVIIQNAGGTIRAAGAGSVVSLGDSHVAGGTLDAAGGSFTLANATFDGRAAILTTNLDLSVTGGRLNLMGSVANAGDVTFSHAGGLFIAAPTILSGGGSITINPPYHFSITAFGGVAGATLNNVNNTIGGSGSLGANSGIVLVNGAAGTISANQAGNTLFVETGSSLINHGVLSANRGILDVRDNLTGTGRLEVTNGGTLVVDQGTDQRVIFVGASADTLALSRREASDGGFDFSISDMRLGDRIRLDVAAGAGQEAAFSFAHTATGGNLSSAIFADGLGAQYLIRLSGAYSYGQFQLVGGADGLFGFVRVASRDGGSGNDVLTAASGGQRLVGLGGNDTLIGRAGNDILDGSLGNDTADFRFATSGVVVSLALSGVQTVGGGLGSDQLVSVENLTGSAHSDLLGGNGLANTLAGGAGNDTLDGGGGNDTMLGGAGNDIYLVNAAGDRVFETTTLTSGVNAGGTDTVQSAVAFNLDAYAGLRFVENLALTGAADITGSGNALANRLTGNLGNNVLNGRAGNDTMLGGAGNDIYLVDSAGDRVFETTTMTSGADAGGTDTVQSAVAFNLDAYAGLRFVEHLTLTGVANITGSGNALANRVIGNGGNNVLNGRAGNDTMTGGAGNDAFLFNTAPGAGNIDRITDFSVADDVIQLEDALFTSIARGVLDPAAFAANLSGQATTGAHRIIHETDAGRLFFDADGAGGAARVQFATVTPGLVLTNADFFVF